MEESNEAAGTNGTGGEWRDVNDVGAVIERAVAAPGNVVDGDDNAHEEAEDGEIEEAPIIAEETSEAAEVREAARAQCAYPSFFLLDFPLLFLSLPLSLPELTDVVLSDHRPQIAGRSKRDTKIDSASNTVARTGLCSPAKTVERECAQQRFRSSQDRAESAPQHTCRRYGNLCFQFFHSTCFQLIPPPSCI